MSALLPVSNPVPRSPSRTPALKMMEHKSDLKYQTNIKHILYCLLADMILNVLPLGRHDLKYQKYPVLPLGRHASPPHEAQHAQPQTIWC